MIANSERRLVILAVILIAVVALYAAALAGCGGLASPTPSRPGEESTATPVSTPLTPTNPSPTPTPPEPLPSAPLAVWGPVQFSPEQDDAGQLVLRTQYEAFSAGHGDIEVEYVPKVAYGEAGVVSFLLDANYAAPTTLPDLAIVDPFELESLVKEGLAQPVQGLVSDELIEDLYPFAREACRFDDELFGIQFEADIEHLVYYTGTLEGPPATWADLFADPISYTFPAAGVGGLVNDTFLIQYLAQGGTLLDEEGNPAVEEGAVQRVLRFYDALREWQVSPPGVLEMSSLEDCWKAYTGGNITVSHISSWQYLTSRPLMRDSDFAAVPTENGVPATMSRGWAFVIISRSRQRQEAAAELIEWLMLPENLAPWSEAANHLPTRGSSLALVGWPKDYKQFLEGQMRSAFYRPSGSQFQRVARALQVAVRDVLTQDSTPREATAQVMASLE